MFRSKTVYVINEQVLDTHQRPSFRKRVASTIEGVGQYLHSIVKHRENERRHTPETVGEEVPTMLTTQVPSVENILQDRKHHLVSTLKWLPKRLGRLAKTILEASILCKGIVCGLTFLSFGVAYICYPPVAMMLFTSPFLICLVPLLMILIIWLFYSKPVASESAWRHPIFIYSNTLLLNQVVQLIRNRLMGNCEVDSARHLVAPFSLFKFPAERLLQSFRRQETFDWAVQQLSIDPIKWTKMLKSSAHFSVTCWNMSIKWINRISSAPASKIFSSSESDS